MLRSAHETINPVDAQELVAENIELNADAIRDAGGCAAVQAFVWGDSGLSDLPEEWRTPDLVVAADVIYHRELFGPLLDALTHLGGLSLCPDIAAAQPVGAS
jgi:hypothetical protein